MEERVSILSVDSSVFVQMLMKDLIVNWMLMNVKDLQALISDVRMERGVKTCPALICKTLFYY